MLTFDTNCWYFDILFIWITTNFSNALNLVTASSFIVKKWNDDIQKQIKPVLRRYKNNFVASPTKLIAIEYNSSLSTIPALLALNYTRYKYRYCKQIYYKGSIHVAANAYDYDQIEHCVTRGKSQRLYVQYNTDARCITAQLQQTKTNDFI